MGTAAGGRFAGKSKKGKLGVTSVYVMPTRASSDLLVIHNVLYLLAPPPGLDLQQRHVTFDAIDCTQPPGTSGKGSLPRHPVHFV